MADWNLFRNRHPDIRGIVGLQSDLSLNDEIIHRSNLELLVRLVPNEVKRKKMLKFFWLISASIPERKFISNEYKGSNEYDKLGRKLIIWSGQKDHLE